MVVISGDLHALATGATADIKGSPTDGYNCRQVLITLASAGSRQLRQALFHTAAASIGSGLSVVATA